MTPFAQFIEAVRRLAPEYRRLIDQAVEQSGEDPFPVMKLLVERGIVGQMRACQLWADSIGVAHVNPFNVELPVGEGAQLPHDIARRARAVVLNSLPTAATVAMVDPTNATLVASLAKVLGREVSPVFAHPEEIDAILRLHFGDPEDLAASLERVCESLPTLEGGREIRDARDVAELVHGEAFAELFNSILLTAFRRRASDIHLESAVDQCRVRMRIDGDMVPILQLPRVVHDALIVRVKVLCQLDVAQHRLRRLQRGRLPAAVQVAQLGSAQFMQLGHEAPSLP